MKLRLFPLLPLVLLTGCSSINGYNYDNEGFKVLEGSYVELEGINSVTVDWVNGNVYFEQSTEDYVSVKESLTDYPLYYKVAQNSLIIRFTKSGMPARIVNKLEKSLYISLPANLDALKVETVDTYVNCSTELHLNKADFNTVNGYIGTRTYQARETKINSVGTSYSFSRLMTYPDETSNFVISAVESDVNIGYREKDGFDIKWNGVQSTYSDDKYGNYKYGAGNNKIDFNGVKSNLSLYSVYEEEGEQQ